MAMIGAKRGYSMASNFLKALKTSSSSTSFRPFSGVVNSEIATTHMAKWMTGKSFRTSCGLVLLRKKMQSMQIRTVLKPSSFSKSPLATTEVSSGHGNVHVSKVYEWKTIRLNQSHIGCGRLNSSQNLKLTNYPETANKYITKVQRSQRRKTQISASAASEFPDNAHDSGKSFGAMLDVIRRYSRLHTIKGTAMSIISVSLLAVQSLTDFTPSFFLGVLRAVLGGCLVNLYIVGLNQLTDIEIDKVNKPHLPLASGELPIKFGVLLTSLYAFLAFCIGLSAKSWPLKLGLSVWIALGTAYSLPVPLLRWKRIPVLAATCIWSVTGVIIPILFHLNAQIYIEGRALTLSKHAIFVSVFMSIYSIVFTLFKDIPDVEGDKLNGVNTIASRFGQKRVFWICIWLLEMIYGMAILVGLSSTHLWIRSLMVIGHSALGFILWRSANLVDLKSNEATESFFLFLWTLFYVEYLFVPILRL